MSRTSRRGRAAALPRDLLGASATRRRAGWPLPRIASMFVLVALLVAMLAGGGCSSGEPGVGSSGTGLGVSGTQVGAITGFGSVIVEGRRYDDTGATIGFDIDPLAPRAAAASDLRLGMRAELVFENDTLAKSVVVRPTLVGRIDTADADRFTVARQDVLVVRRGIAATVLDGFDAATPPATGDLVEVHGTRNAAGEIEATRIARRPTTAVPVLRIVGDVAALDGATAFRVGALRVDTTATTRLLPAGRLPAVGDRVTVVAAGIAALDAARSGAVRADVVRVDAFAEATRVRLAGLVRLRQPGSDRFVVDDALVDARAARFVDAAPADIVAGRFVRVEGVWSGARLQATEVRLLRELGDPADVTGLVGDYVSVASFTVRGVRVDASSAAVEYRGGDASSIADGVLVDVRGFVSDGLLRATRIEFRVDPDSRTRALAGVVSGYDPASGAFSILGASARLAAGAVLRFGDGSAAPAASFQNGVLATVDGRFDGGVFIVDVVTLARSGEARQVTLEGRAFRVDTVQRTMRLNGVDVVWDAQTRIDGAPTDLVGGASVRVEGSVVSGRVAASRITIESPAQAKGQP
ncbi:MAG: DUF5666 domain-containing protein [Lautropia sp.]